MTSYLFEHADEALKWAVEVLRKRRLPKLGSFWREIEAEADWVEQAWEGRKNVALPNDAEDRLSLALKVMNAVDAIGEEGARLLKMWAWGDWVDEGRLRSALAIQEKCRREGLRVRIAYRYTYAQLGVILDCDKKVAWRKVQDALRVLGQELERKGLVIGIEAPVGNNDSFKKKVYYNEFN